MVNKQQLLEMMVQLGLNQELFRSQEEAFKYCPACCEDYDSDSHVPALLSCGHVCCKKCINTKYCQLCAMCQTKVVIEKYPFSDLLSYFTEEADENEAQNGGIGKQFILQKAKEVKDTVVEFLDNFEKKNEVKNSRAKQVQFQLEKLQTTLIEQNMEHDSNMIESLSQSYAEEKNIEEIQLINKLVKKIGQKNEQKMNLQYYLVKALEIIQAINQPIDKLISNQKLVDELKEVKQYAQQLQDSEADGGSNITSKHSHEKSSIFVDGEKEEGEESKTISKGIISKYERKILKLQEIIDTLAPDLSMN